MCSACINPEQCSQLIFNSATPEDSMAFLALLAAIGVEPDFDGIGPNGYEAIASVVLSEDGRHVVAPGGNLIELPATTEVVQI